MAAQSTSTKQSPNGQSAAPEDGIITIPALDIRRLALTLVGDSPLICHHWDEKARQMIEAKQQGKALNKKPPRDPQAEYEASFYRQADSTPGFPAVNFKAAAIAACRQVDGLKMKVTRSTFHVLGDVLPLRASEPVMRSDMVRIGMGTADVRYRPMFETWEVDLEVDYNAAAITGEQIVHLFNVAGFGIGVGDYRPEKSDTGQFGRFHVKADP